MEFGFSGEVIGWHGPAPHHFVAVPDDIAAELAAQPELSYGWGCIPVRVTIGDTRFTTSLMPKEGRYLVPLKAAVRRAEGIELGEEATLSVDIDDAH